MAKAEPDGHTLLMNAGAFVINALLHSKPPYDPQRDFAPVMQIATVPNVLVVNPALPAPLAFLRRMDQTDLQNNGAQSRRGGPPRPR